MLCCEFCSREAQAALHARFGEVGTVQSSGESTQRPPILVRGSILVRCHMSVEFVAGLGLLRGFFSGFPGFPTSKKTNICTGVILSAEELVTMS